MNMLTNKEVGFADLLKNGQTLKQFRDGIIERTKATGYYNGQEKLEFRDSDPIGWHEDTQDAREEIGNAIQRVQRGRGVLILTDMFGGTPSNLAISIIDRAKIEVIAGMNLPMLIKLASVRNTEKLADAVTAAREAGRKYINVASQLLAGESR